MRKLPRVKIFWIIAIGKSVAKVRSSKYLPF